MSIFFLFKMGSKYSCGGCGSPEQSREPNGLGFKLWDFGVDSSQNCIPPSQFSKSKKRPFGANSPFSLSHLLPTSPTIENAAAENFTFVPKETFAGGPKLQR